MKNPVCLFFAFLFILIPLSTSGSPSDADSCIGYSTALIVETFSHTMSMCQEDHAVKTFRVAIGRGGIDKRIRGDGKTPLGEYVLGVPRPSGRFRLFIPIAYPDAAQVLNGYSGGDIGIHGPNRGSLWLGPSSAFVDWTLGCVAVGTDDDISVVAQWVKDHNVNRVIIK